MSSQPFATPALLLAIAAMPLVFGLVPPNRFYGVRTAKTLSNSALWYRVNRFAAVGMAAFVLPLIICLSLARRFGNRL